MVSLEMPRDVPRKNAGFLGASMPLLMALAVAGFCSLLAGLVPGSPAEDAACGRAAPAGVHGPYVHVPFKGCVRR